MERSEIISVVLARTAPANRWQLRRTLELKSTEELEQMHREIVLEAAEDELTRIRAERDADRVLHRIHMDKIRQPQQQGEEKRQLALDKDEFDRACRQF